MIRNFDALVIGAGAAGLVCAVEAGKRGRRVAVLLFSGAQGMAPAVQTVPTGPGWAPVVVPLDGFAGADLAQVRAFAITTPDVGEFAFDLDQVEIR